MILEFLNMNGYGMYVISAFAFTLMSFTVLYIVIRSQLIKEQKNSLRNLVHFHLIKHLKQKDKKRTRKY